VTIGNLLAAGGSSTLSRDPNKLSQITIWLLSSMPWKSILTDVGIIY
jgi:hypothetical protein